MAGSFSTSFDNSIPENNGVIFFPRDLGGEISYASIKAWDFTMPWPDNAFRRKLQFDLFGASTGGAQMNHDMDSTAHQYAEVEFYAPIGIVNHIALGVQTYFDPYYWGYNAILGGDLRLGGGLRLGIEKSIGSGGNSLFNGVPVTLKPARPYKISIEVTIFSDHAAIFVDLYRYDDGYDWSHVASSYCVDYDNVLTGAKAWFASVFDDSTTYWDKFNVSW